MLKDSHVVIEDSGAVVEVLGATVEGVGALCGSPVFGNLIIWFNLNIRDSSPS
jgi:hypothetical protein